ncbi:dicarboxylate/amino acid:cation symporter [Desulfovibrio sp. An276]|nr:dicarboxylate/amino acid:cation symporter [Desulfovibrio sp. An276]
MEGSMKKMGLPMQMGIGMVLGILVGLLASNMGWSASYFQPLGQLFINLIRMVVVPLVFVTLVAGAASVGDVRSLGRIATKTLIYYFLTTAIAIVIGLILANIFQPGVGLDLSKDNLKAVNVTPPALSAVLLGIIPINPMDALAKGNMLQIIFFAVLVGLCINMCSEKTKVVSSFFDGMSEIMIKVTTIVMLYAPIGVFALMAVTVTNHGIAVLLPLIKLVAIMYVASICQILFIYLPCVRYSKIKFTTFFKVLSAPLMIAFTTCSSAAALSANLIGVQKLGASKQVSTFSIPLGNTINMDGAAIYMGIASIFAAQVYGIPMPLDKQITIVIMAILASIGSMGVPGAALIMITMVFTQVGIPLEAIALVAGVDRIMDMARTTINVLGDATGAVFVSRLENDLDPERGAKIEG